MDPCERSTSHTMRHQNGQRNLDTKFYEPRWFTHNFVSKRINATYIQRFTIRVGINRFPNKLDSCHFDTEIYRQNRACTFCNCYGLLQLWNKGYEPQNFTQLTTKMDSRELVWTISGFLDTRDPDIKQFVVKTVASDTKLTKLSQYRVF